MAEENRIPITRPYFDDAEAAGVREVLASGWVVQGPRVAAFETAFCQFADLPHAVATTSCTTSLHLAMIVAGVGRGDEVIVPAFTWVATPNAAEYVGARPVFCDIDLDTFNIDPAAYRAAITPRTRAAIPVHLFGLAFDVDAILAASQAQDIRIVEDAACAVGTYYKGRHVGGFGFAGCFSFHPRKAITTGEGGMVTTRHPEIVERLRSLRDHGAHKSDLARHHSASSFLLPEFNEVGFNFRMTDVQGAIGIAQMAKLPAIMAHRLKLTEWYDAGLANVPWLRLPPRREGYGHGYQSYVARVVDPDCGEARLADVPRLHDFRNRVMATLEDQGIATRQGTHAAHAVGYYRNRYGIRVEDFPRAWTADRTSLSLPLSMQMTEADVARVCTRLIAAGARELVTARRTSEAVAGTAGAGLPLRGPETARKRVVVTGAGGYIGRKFLEGSHDQFEIFGLVRRVPESRVPGVEYIVADLSRALDLPGLPHRVDAVLHLAQSNKYRQYPDGAEEVVAVNVGSTVTLANWARNAGVGHFVFASTAGFNPTGIERVDDDAPLIPDSIYTQTKSMAEDLLRGLARHVKIAVLRPYTVYGPGQSGRLIPTIVERVADQVPVTIEGDDRGMRLCPLHVADAVRALQQVIQRTLIGNLNLAGDDVVSVREVATLAGETLGIAPKFQFQSLHPARRLVGANVRMKAILDRPLTAFSTGIGEVLAGGGLRTASSRE